MQDANYNQYLGLQLVIMCSGLKLIPKSADKVHLKDIPLNNSSSISKTLHVEIHQCSTE
ncbi:unnamed protein product, partial [Clonostachys chloroleuca]